MTHMDTTNAGPEFSEIVATMRSRQADRHPLLLEMQDVQRRYNGEWTVPIGTSEDGPEMPPMTPTIIAESVDFLARQASSVSPQLNVPSLSGSDLSIKRANTKRRAVWGLMEHSDWDLMVRRWFRFLAGYAHNIMVITPDADAQLPRYELRNPLSAYPEPVTPDEFRQPNNCGFVTPRSPEWVRHHFPAARTENGGIISSKESGASPDLWDLVEWVDGECVVIGILGRRMYRDAKGRTYSQYVPAETHGPGYMELERHPNRCEMSPIVMANQLTLDRIGSQIANITGIVDFMTRLQALAVLAAEKNIFKDRYIIGRGGATPRLLGGEWQDGRSGKTNIILDGENVGELGTGSDPVNQQMIDRLERNTRMSTGLVPQAGGENYTSLRTGRAVDSILGASVDPRVQEMHEIAQVAFTHAHKRALSMWRKTWGSKTVSMYSGLRSDRKQIEVTPKKDFETLDLRVEYPMPGADSQGLTVMLGQLLGMKMVSLNGARTMHPFVDDPAAEEAAVEREALIEAALAGLANGVVSGEVPVSYLSMVHKHRKDHGDLLDAIVAADEELKREQAKIAEEANPANGEFAPPGQMPGLQPGPDGPPMPPTAGELPPEMMAAMAAAGGPVPPGGPGGPGGPPMGGPPLGRPPGMPPGALPGDMVPREEQRGLRRLMESLSQMPPSQP